MVFCLDLRGKGSHFKKREREREGKRPGYKMRMKIYLSCRILKRTIYKRKKKEKWGPSPFPHKKCRTWNLKFERKNIHQVHCLVKNALSSFMVSPIIQRVNYIKPPRTIIESRVAPFNYELKHLTPLDYPRIYELPLAVKK